MNLLFFLGFNIFPLIIAHNCDANGQPHESQVQVSPTVGMPWPLPQQYAVYNSYMGFKPDNFQIINNSGNCTILLNAIKRYQRLLFLDECLPQNEYRSNSIEHRTINFIKNDNFAGYLYNISVKINHCEQWPHMNMDEQYLLKINSPDIPGQGLLYSNSVWGALRGLETLSQIIYKNADGMFIVNSTLILDFPRFSHRGVLLDTSRHFVPVNILLQNLDAMAQNKMNVFHWHIVDDQSFPYVSKAFPNLSAKGAFNPKTHIYSVSDVANVINYARERGIRVVPEFDTPGHTLSWGKGQPDLLTPCYKNGVPDGTYGPIDPTVESSYKFLNSFFSEVAKVFPDTYLHLGGDEVSFDCWKSNPNITAFMKKQKFGVDYSKLEEYYETRILQLASALKKSYIIWQEVFDNKVQVKPDTVIHVWKNPQAEELTKVTAAGYHTLLSTCWYLNYINYGNDWTSFYTCDPYAFNGTEKQKTLVLGGEACMWGEYVDGINVMSRTWPRASAVAERLWSSVNVTDVASATPRLEEHRCRMLQRGLKVEPVNGPGFCKCDYMAK
ncbi:beta-hexosaminidase subunit alpha-like [Centruroides vittatus]|uniref:beta-hexosaminidase subunit alpha-like n=1 Tax=Centruroides vittatus TaxID=120091 RepID=UPI00350EC2CE